MTPSLFYGLFLPFAGTVLGAVLVFFMKKGLPCRMESGLAGLAAGVMVAASIWSLLLPAMERSADMGRLAFLPAVLGTLSGFAALLVLHRLLPPPALKDGENREEGLSKIRMLFLSVSIHNVPEGMAVGVLVAAESAGDPGVGFSEVLALALGIAIQNFPEGAIVSLPLCGYGTTRPRAFLLAVLSAVFELLGAVLALLMATTVRSLLPFLLSFAAGAMLFVVVCELVPDAKEDTNTSFGTVLFAIGFCLMMALDVALG